jgi:carbon storage regulator
VLVVTRKLDEAVILGDHIKVKIIQIHGKQVRLGIEAPPGILIMREEKTLYKAAKQCEPRFKQIHAHDLADFQNLLSLKWPV